MIYTHAHLNEVTDCDEALARALSAGVTRIIAVGMDKESNKEVLSLAARYPLRIYPAIGYHPSSIVEDEIDDTLQFIKDNLTAALPFDLAGRIAKFVESARPSAGGKRSFPAHS